jgi:hypothetical protein
MTVSEGSFFAVSVAINAMATWQFFGRIKSNPKMLDESVAA